MKSIVATLLTLVALACTAAPALAMPADNGPPAAGHDTSRAPAPKTPDTGLGTTLYIVIGVGGALALATAGYGAVHVANGRRIRLHHS
jgi:hypothetical protein